jgi:hypothetical protein
MRRVLQFLQWQRRFWEVLSEFMAGDVIVAEDKTEELVGSRLLLDQRTEGVRAYGLRQACIRRNLHDHFKTLWHGVPALVISEVGKDPDTILSSVLDINVVEKLMLAASFLQH